MLPCPHCGYDFLEFIKVNDLYENTDPFNPACKGSQAYGMPCQGPATVRFFCRRGAARRRRRRRLLRAPPRGSGRRSGSSPQTRQKVFFISFSLSRRFFSQTFPFFKKSSKTKKQACANQANLVNFFLRAHFNVDTLTKPCKKLW